MQIFEDVLEKHPESTQEETQNEAADCESSMSSEDSDTTDLSFNEENLSSEFADNCNINFDDNLIHVEDDNLQSLA